MHHPRTINQIQQILIPPRHVFFGHKAQGRAVDAIAQSAGLPGAVAEYMPQVGVSRAAARLRPAHAMRMVMVFADHARVMIGS